MSRLSSRDGQAVQSRRAVGILRLGQQLLDLGLGQDHLLERMAVASRAVLAGVGEDLGAVHRRGDEDTLESGLKQLLVLTAEFAYRIVIGMGVGSEIACRHIFMDEGLDAAAGKSVGGIAVEQ